MARPESKNRHIAVAAIDFGTTCTGYAFNFRKADGIQIKDINTDQAWLGTHEIGLQAPTTVLLEPDQKFHSFGFEAEAKYHSLALKNNHSSWFYFQHFKMKLHHEKDLSRDTLLEEANGKTMKAMVIFTEAIKYVKKHLMDKLKNSIKDEIGLSDIKWVITVPAIWRDSAKQFMREAASKAGIPNDQLMLALEPESAAIFCKELTISKTEGVEGAFLRAFDPGEKYIVVDLGGGTVETTGHEVLPDGSLKELHAATGGPWGGQMVNEAFENYIRKMISDDDISTLPDLVSRLASFLPKDNENKEIYLVRAFAVWLREIIQRKLAYETPKVPEELAQFIIQGDYPTNAFDKFCQTAKIESEIVIGIKKGVNYRAGDATETAEKHTSRWSVFKCNEQWHILNTGGITKTRGFKVGDETIIERNGETCVQREEADRGIKMATKDDFWFCPNPEIFVMRHYPNEEKWQLLPKQKVVNTLEDFFALPSFNTTYYQSKLCLLSEYTCKLKSKRDEPR